MAASPQWKVYDSYGTYQAATKEVEAAAALMGFYGDGSTIRYGHGFILWTEGQEECPAGESYDTVAETAHVRLSTYQAASYANSRGISIEEARAIQARGAP